MGRSQEHASMMGSVSCQCGQARPVFGPHGSTSISDAKWCSACPGKPAAAVYLGGRDVPVWEQQQSFLWSIWGAEICSEVVLQVPRQASQCKELQE